MNEGKIIIIGAGIIDVLVRPASPEVFRSGSYAAQDIHMSPGGDALNEATILAHMGKQVELQTVVGDDMAGELIRKHCQECGIELSAASVRKGMSTGINVVLVQENGERSFLTNPNGSLRKLSLQDITIPFHKEARILCLASIFVSSRLSTGDLQHIFQAAKRQGILVCADLTKPKLGERLEDMAPALKYVDYLIPNRQEACLLTGKEQVEEAAEAILEAGTANVVIKSGAKGCYILNKEKSKWIPGVPGVRCIDTTGAGDSFAAGFLFGLSEGYSIERCAEYGNQCGAKAVAVMGAADWIHKA